MSDIVCITGATSGFGEACARKYADAGYSLIITGRRQERLEKLAAELSSKTQVHWIALDVCDAEQVKHFLPSLPAEFRTISILINNAGLALGTGPAQEANLSDWETMIDTNVKGLVRMTHALLPSMVENKKGHVVNVGSIAGSWPYPGGNTYCGTKAFVEQFSRCLRADVLGKNIRVSTVSPGLAETEFSVVRMKGDQDKADALYENAEPLTAQDIADIIFWMTSAPAHVNINAVEVMPTTQAWGPLNIFRHQ